MSEVSKGRVASEQERGNFIISFHEESHDEEADIIKTVEPYVHMKK